MKISYSNSESFQKCSVCTLSYCFLPIVWRRVCRDSRNVNNKYYIVIPPVKQSL